MKKVLSLAFTLTVFACGGDKPSDTAAAKTDAPAAPTPEQVREQQKRYADSVLNTVASVSEVAKKAGSKYEVGSVMLRDTVAARITKADCLTAGRTPDPFLSGSVIMWVNMGIAGSDAIRIQESKWTSPAGQLVDACITKAAGTWKFGPEYGKPKAYLVQVLFKDER